MLELYLFYHPWNCQLYTHHCLFYITDFQLINFQYFTKPILNGILVVFYFFQ